MSTLTTSALSLPAQLRNELREQGFGPHFGTPCGVLAPLYEAMDGGDGVTTIPREDNAVGVAAGAALSGRSPIVLMQNSGFGQSVNAIASLVVPYGIPILFIVSMRGVAPDDTAENEGMGTLTEPICRLLGLPTVHLDSAADAAAVAASLAEQVIVRREPAVLLVAPDAFGWRA
ncbi:thiamine pyrophosphate-binding protein [Couchioplanes caeruleus]|uniref:Sulfopyruvate decarboxylase subunit alpha n=1 Tax=Couchioplanes caeruleus TaxID=56438 RepID=A0A3N1GMC4_9ACTN|nr:thiamine pyrophosphate-binding protein [Couchioplanes caeruleus]ROP31359.1 sulfopyruvate decarboxylase subunit alpha [Couchioplanes caeruleus]